MSASPSPPGAARAVVSVPFGPPALGALAGAISAARRGDPLAPVTVIIPSGHAAVSVRRHLARLRRDDGRVGLVNVHWRSFPQVAALLAGGGATGGRPPLTGLVRRAAVRAALAEVPSAFSVVADNPATEDRLAATFGVFDQLAPDVLDQVAATGRRGRDLVALHTAHRRHCGDHATEHDALDVATAAVRDWAGGRPGGAIVERSLGAVVVYLPTHLSSRERALLDALGELVPVTVVLGVTDEPGPDAATIRLRESLVASFGSATVITAPAVPAASPGHVRDVTVVRAPDPEEEVRTAVRRVLQALSAGVAPDDIALVSRLPEPHLLLAHELLEAAGVPHHAPAGPSLAQSVAGRALLGFVRVAARGFHRAELFRWVRSAPIRQADGTEVPASFDALARRAGVGAGIEQWRRRLDRYRADQVERSATSSRAAARVAEVDRLAAFVEHLAALAEPPADASWAAQATWAGAALDTLLGGRDAVASGEGAWPDRQLADLDEVHRVVADLAALDAVEPAPGAAQFRRVLVDEVTRRRRPLGRFGHGVFVGGVDDLVGARHELVIVLGMAEGQFPPRPTGDPVLTDEVAALLGDDPAVARRDRVDERRSWVALRAAAPHLQLSFARVDTRSQRATLPSRWFLEEVSELVGGYVGFDDLDGIVHPSVVDVASFESATRAALVPVDRGEAAMAALLRGVRADEPAVDRGLGAIRARLDGEFGEWTGAVHPANAPRFDDARPASSTRLETWAKCPFQYFLGHVLHVGPYEDHADADSINLLDRGSLVHEVLEHVIGEGLAGAPDQAGAVPSHDRLRTELTAVAGRYEAEGRTGRPLLWEAELDRLLRLLEHTLETDAHWRAGGARPVAVELAFGDDERSTAPAVRVTLPSGREVAFHGTIDRVDRNPDTGRLVVLDYKTGSDDGYKQIRKRGEKPGKQGDDVTCAGRHLQLVIYAEAAKQHFGGDAEAFFWFLERGVVRGQPIGDAELARFVAVLATMVEGIEGGVFPANPGAADTFYNTWANCSWCPYDRICPAAREEQWESVRLDERVRPYLELSTPAQGSAP